MIRYGMVRKVMSWRLNRPSFDPKSFLARVGEGRSIAKYRKGQVVFSQGDAGDAVFYIQKGKAKITVVSEQGKEAVVAILGTNEFSARDVRRAGTAYLDGYGHDGRRHRAAGKVGDCPGDP